MRKNNFEYGTQENITRANTAGNPNGFAMTAASTRNFIFS
jgi:adenosine deaminase